MIQNYKLDTLFGPSAIFAGYVLLAVGLITVYFTFTAIPLILIGAAMAFSFYSSQIDSGNKCFRVSLNLFGFYPVGKWIDFNTTDEITVERFKGHYNIYSRSNRQLQVTVSDFRVVLVSGNTKKKTHLAKFPSEAGAIGLAKQLEKIIQQ
jgi:hypothetical protein